MLELRDAIFADDEMGVRRLLAEGLDPNGVVDNSLPLNLALDNANIFELFVSAGADVNARNAGMTALHHAMDYAIDGAIQDGTEIDLAIVRRLVELGADVAARTSDGATIRDIACTYGAYNLLPEIDRWMARAGNGN